MARLGPNHYQSHDWTSDLRTQIVILLCRDIKMRGYLSVLNFQLFMLELFIYFVLASTAFNLSVLPASTPQQSSALTSLYALLA